MVPLSDRLRLRDLLGDRAGQILGGDHGRIIGAGDGDVDLLVISRHCRRRG